MKWAAYGFMAIMIFMMGVFLWQAVELFIATDAFFEAWDKALTEDYRP